MNKFLKLVKFNYKYNYGYLVACALLLIPVIYCLFRLYNLYDSGYTIENVLYAIEWARRNMDMVERGEIDRLVGLPTIGTYNTGSYSLFLLTCLFTLINVSVTFLVFKLAQRNRLKIYTVLSVLFYALILIVFEYIILKSSLLYGITGRLNFPEHELLLIVILSSFYWAIMKLIGNIKAIEQKTYFLMSIFLIIFVITIYPMYFFGWILEAILLFYIRL